MKAIVVEDNIGHKEWMIAGVKASEYDFEIIDANVKDVVKALVEENNVDLLIAKGKVHYVIDVNLTNTPEEEYGLLIYNKLKKIVDPQLCRFLILSNWDKMDFKTNVDLESENTFFIDKRLFLGFELKFKVKSMTNKLWKS